MGRLAVSPTLRGCHAGTKLLAHAFRDVFSRDIDRFVAEARDTTVHILLKFGAEVTGPATEFFGSSITPLLMEYYSRITVVDIRYMASSLLDQYVDFTDADVLFLYCTSMFNAGATLK